MAGENVKHLTDAEFEEYVLKADLPSLVDFWAPWCGPCKAIGPVIEELAEEYAGKVQITKMNVDDNPTTPGKYSIRAIPTLILFKGGEIVDQYPDVSIPLGGDSAASFLGTQGDEWDSQWDMFLALVGAVLSLAVLSRVHDRALARAERIRSWVYRSA